MIHYVVTTSQSGASLEIATQLRLAPKLHPKKYYWKRRMNGGSAVILLSSIHRKSSNRTFAGLGDVREYHMATIASERAHQRHHWIIRRKLFVLGSSTSATLMN